MSYFLKMFINKNRKLFVSELGHSILEQSRTVGPRSREIYILHFVVKGYCEFSGFRAEAGQVFLISRGIRHQFTVSDNYEHYWIGFMGDSVEELFEIFGHTDTPHQLFCIENPDFVKELFSAALEKLQNEDTEFSDSFVLAVLTAILPLLKKEAQSEMGCGTNYAEKVRLFIEANYIHPVKMTEIAQHIHLSEKHMCRLFVRNYNISPQSFLMQTRMEAAKALLAKNEAAVKEVAYSVGYTSLPAFSKAFSNYFGMSPGSFKKTITQADSPKMLKRQI